MEKNIYEKGIRFKCQGSSNCCVTRGSNGYVFLSNKDLSRLAKYFNMSLIKFKKNYCQTTNGFIHLKETRKNGECIFLNKKKCTVYKARPTQCRPWPFWPENMNSKIWNKEIVNFCPGIGKGKMISKDKIYNFLKIDELNAKKIIKKKTTYLLK